MLKNYIQEVNARDCVVHLNQTGRTAAPWAAYAIRRNPSTPNLGHVYTRAIGYGDTMEQAMEALYKEIVEDEQLAPGRAKPSEFEAVGEDYSDIC